MTTNPITDARESGTPDTPQYDALPAFPGIPTIPGSAAPERSVSGTPAPAPTPVVTSTEPTVPEATAPTPTPPPAILPELPAESGLRYVDSQSVPALTPDRVQGENAAFVNQVGTRNVEPLLPNPFAFQGLSPDVLYGNASGGTTAMRTSGTNIVEDWLPWVNSLQNSQRAEERAWLDRIRSGLEIRSEMDGSLAPIDMVGGNVPNGAGSTVGRGGVFNYIGAWLIDRIMPGKDYADQFSGAGDFGSGWLGGLFEAVSTFQNTTYGIALDVANNTQALGRAALNTPFDMSDFVDNMRQYQQEFRGDADPTNYMDRAAQGVDLGFSNYGRMESGRVNPLGLWGTENSTEIQDIMRWAGAAAGSMARNLDGSPTPEALEAMRVRDSITPNFGRLGLMALGLTLDVVTDPSDLAKLFARITGGARAARSLGEATQLSRRAAPTASPETLTSVLSTEGAEAISAVQQAERMRATLPDILDFVRPRQAGSVMSPELRSMLPNYTLPTTPPSVTTSAIVPSPAGALIPAPIVQRPIYYSPSAIVSDITASSVAAPTALRGTPDFVVNSVDTVADDVITAAPAIADELAAIPLKSYDVIDAVVVSVARAAGDDTLNLIPNILAPVNRQSVNVIDNLAGDAVVLDIDTLAATLPRNVGNASRQRLTLYNIGAGELETLPPATAAPQRVYIEAPSGMADSPYFPTSIDAARPLADVAFATDKATVIAKADKYLAKLAKKGYVQRNADYSGFILSTKTNDIAYSNPSNLVRLEDAESVYGAMGEAYQRQAKDLARIYRQTRLGEVLAPSAQRTPDMFVELATGYAPKLPTTPNRTLSRSIDSVLSAEDRFTNASRVLQRVESEAANVKLGMRNTTISEGFVNRTGTVKRLKDKAIRTSPTAFRERAFLRAMEEVDEVVNLKVDVKNAARDTYSVDLLPKDAQPLTKNGRLNVTPAELEELMPLVDDLVVDIVDRGYVHFNLVDSLHVLPDGTLKLSDNLQDTQKIDDIFHGVASVDEIDEVRRVERSIAHDRLANLRDNFNIDEYELGNQPRYTEGMFDNALARTVYEYDGDPSNLGKANQLRYQTKYELDRAAMLAKRELEAAIIARETAVTKFKDDVAAYNKRQAAITQEKLKAKQARIDKELSRGGGTCL